MPYRGAGCSRWADRRTPPGKRSRMSPWRRSSSTAASRSSTSNATCVKSPRLEPSLTNRKNHVPPPHSHSKMSPSSSVGFSPSLVSYHSRARRMSRTGTAAVTIADFSIGCRQRYRAPVWMTEPTRRTPLEWHSAGMTPGDQGRAGVVWALRKWQTEPNAEGDASRPTPISRRRGRPVYSDWRALRWRGRDRGPPRCHTELVVERYARYVRGMRLRDSGRHGIRARCSVAPGETNQSLVR